MSLDLNPNRIGIAVLEQKDKECKPLHWAFYDYPELNRKLKLAPTIQIRFSSATNGCTSLSCIAKEVVALADHFQCGAVVTEHLNIGTEDHGKGRSFNRAVNNQWTRKGFVLPLVRRLEACRHSACGSQPGLQFQGWQPALGLANVYSRSGLRGRRDRQTISSR